ncbi:unnamed protein product [Schistosoma margrebowiei]|uniref:Uncharacterized protein n=1 Tax=Schistosoma margrebowiei TaxID=48269 RepID=A0A183MT80_9TREM|nr:unnamed protein product [Schistosoma margrebowiei]
MEFLSSVYLRSCLLDLTSQTHFKLVSQSIPDRCCYLVVVVGLACRDEATELYWLEQPFLKVLPYQTGRLKSVHTQGYADNSLRSCDAVHENGHNFGQYLSCGRSHSFIWCKFRNSKCFECGDIGHIQSVCNTTVHLATNNIKSCDSDSIKSSVPNDHSSLSTISKDSVESYSSSELNETQSPCETTVSNQSTYQISHVIVPDMVFPNDSLISDEIPCKSEENMLNEPSRDRKPDAVLIDADFF